MYVGDRQSLKQCKENRFVEGYFLELGRLVCIAVVIVCLATTYWYLYSEINRKKAFLT